MDRVWMFLIGGSIGKGDLQLYNYILFQTRIEMQDYILCGALLWYVM